MKCNVCGHEFTPKKEDRYEAVKPAPLFQCATHYDCFDCPVCGCQIVA
jgi:rubredoxin